MKIQLSDHFTMGRLMRFVLPSIVMMLFTSIYVVIDGIFVSLFVGKTAFAAVNLIYPVIGLMGCPAFMIGTGGSALIGRTLGMGNKEKANRIFSLLVTVTIVLGVGFTILGLVFLRPLAIWLGAEGQMLEDCILYGGILLLFVSVYMLQLIFQFFLIAAEKPTLNLGFTVASGLTNAVLDLVFVGILHWGIAGAAFATVTSQFLGGVVPLIYFLLPNSSLLRLRKPQFNGRVLWKTCTNGVSELLSNVSFSIVTMLYNFQMMALAGEDGVAAFGVVMYVAFIFIAIYIGYSYGCAPVISFHFGAGNSKELQNLLRLSTGILAIGSLCLTAIAIVLAKPLAWIFVNYDPQLMEMTAHGLRLYSISFLLSGFAIFSSGFFTALNDGLISGMISFLRTLVFQILTLLIMPVIWGLDGVWLAIVAAEAMSVILAVCILWIKRKTYHYF